VRGHQPFFVAAAAFAVLSIAVWLSILDGAVQPSSSLPAASWHAHEMLFGYTLAVLAGFLLLGARGPRVWLLVAIWAAGRLAMAATSALPAELVAAIDIAFAPALALLRAPSLWSSWKWPTVGFVPLLGGVAAANLLWHLGAVGIAPGGARAGELVMLDLVTLMMVVMAGRLVPGYTRAMLIPVRTPKDPVLERWSIGLALALLIADQGGWAAAAGLSAAGLGSIQTVRLSDGGPATSSVGPSCLSSMPASLGWPSGFCSAGSPRSAGGCRPSTPSMRSRSARSASWRWA
jgi:uncharacterized protein involved in response to NO